MDSQYLPSDSKGRTSFYKHQTRNLYNPCTELNATIYRYKSWHDQTPLNFIGRKSLHPPTDDSHVYNPRPMEGVWRAVQHIPILHTAPIIPKIH